MNIKIFSLATMLLISTLGMSQSVIGIWKAIDDSDGQPTSHIEVFEKNGKVFGKIIKLYDQPDDIRCELCKGDLKDELVLGMEIIYNMKEKGDEYHGGTIMDPENGKSYKCKMGLNEDGTLWVRGFIGFSLLGRTQTWHPVEG